MDLSTLLPRNSRKELNHMDKGLKGKSFGVRICQRISKENIYHEIRHRRITECRKEYTF